MRTMTRLVAVLVLALPITAPAVPITIHFSGHITSVADPLGINPDVALGSVFSGSFTFDDSVLPRFATPESAHYFDVITAFDVNLEGVSFTRSTQRMGPADIFSSAASINNDFPPPGSDRITFGSAVQRLPGDPTTGVLFRNASVYGFSSNPGALTGTSLPTSLDLAAFDVTPLTLDVYYQQSEQFFGPFVTGYYRGEITSLAPPASVPEPATLGLMATGLLVLLARRRPRPAQTIA